MHAASCDRYDYRVCSNRITTGTVFYWHSASVHTLFGLVNANLSAYVVTMSFS